MTRWTLRRFVAMLGLVTLGIFLAEPLIADICDRDGRGLEWSIGAPGTPPSLPAPDEPSPHQAAHVCHCAHAHVGGVTLAPALHVTPVVGKYAAQQPEWRFMSLTFQPRLRPPIA